MMLQWFHNMKIPVKFMVSFGIILTILLVSNSIGLLNSGKINDSMVDLYQNNLLKIKNVGEISSSFHRINTAVGSYMLNDEADFRKKQKELIASNEKTIDDILALFASIPLTDEEKKDLQIFTSIWQPYKEIIVKVLDLSDQGKVEVAKPYYKDSMLAREQGMDMAFQSFIHGNQTEAEGHYSSALEQYRGIKLNSIMMLAVSLLVSALMGYVLTISVLQPIKRLLKAFARIEAGDLAEPIVIARKDELGQLGEGSEKMRQSVAGIVVQTKQLVGTLSDVSSRIRDYSDQTGETSREIFAGMKEAAQTSEAEAQAIASDAMVITEMAEGLKHIAANVDQVNFLATDMESASSDGRTVVHDALETMTAIRQKSEETTTTIQYLDEHSKEIEQVIVTIKRIADETNMLALNASIEAARAGESGRGFAVVASEVRKLAENSKNAAEQVSDVIKTIQSGTVELLQAGRQLMTQMSEGQGKMQEVSTVFQRIFDMIERMNAGIQDMTASIEEMAAGSEQINHSMKRIESYSGSVSRMTGEYAYKSDQQVHSMNQVKESVDALLAVSNQLGAIVNRFVTE